MIRLALIFVALLAAGCLSDATERRTPPPSETSVSDSDLVSAVSLALADANVPGSEFIQISARNGIVRLAGRLRTRDAASRAANVALKVPGVRRVESEITVAP